MFQFHFKYSYTLYIIYGILFEKITFNFKKTFSVLCNYCYVIIIGTGSAAPTTTTSTLAMTTTPITSALSSSTTTPTTSSSGSGTGSSTSDPSGLISYSVCNKTYTMAATYPKAKISDWKNALIAFNKTCRNVNPDNGQVLDKSRPKNTLLSGQYWAK